MKYSVMVSYLIALFAVLCASPTVYAQTEEQAPQLQQQLAQCATIEDSLKRLVCYDNLAAAPMKVPAKAPAAEFGREHLGPQEAEAQEEQSRMSIDIVSHRKHPHGYLIIKTADGQTWRQVSAEYFPLSDSGSYFIERGFMGAYYLGRTDLNSRTRVKRTN